LLRSEDGVIDTFRVNPAVVPRQEQQAFIPIYVLRTTGNRSSDELAFPDFLPGFGTAVSAFFEDEG
jgi:hypothetical protein